MDGIVINTTLGKMWINVNDILLIIQAGEYCVIKLHGTDRDVTAMHSFKDIIKLINEFNDDEDDDNDDINRLLESLD